MKVEIRRSGVKGTVAAPPSKSYTHRALICSALAQGKSRILNPLYSDDTGATCSVLGELGVGLSTDPELWEVVGGELEKPDSDLFCRESATTLRFMATVCALVDGTSRLTCGPALSRRPVGPLLDGLRQLEVDCRSNGGFPPAVIKGIGRIRGGSAAIRGDISSQFVSAILLVSPLADRPVSLKLTTPLESRPYVSMTMDTQRRFGVEVQASGNMREFQVQRQIYNPTEFAVEGDWSSAAYLLAAGGLAGKVTVLGLKPKSLQADSAIIDILKKMGAQVDLKGTAVSVKSSSLKGLEFDVSDCPDLFPVVSALCAVADGTSVLRGIRRLRYKESDRVMAMVEGLRNMGVKATRRGDGVTIVGTTPRGGLIDPKNDHRIAMAFSVVGLVAEGETVILDADCVSKSYPGFWDAMGKLGVGLRRIGDEQ